MIKTNRTWKGLLVALLVTSGILIACQKDAKNPAVTSAAKGGVSTPSTQYVTPTLSFASATLESIDITVTAGSTGAPSGFSIQWMTQAAFDALGDVWPVYTQSDVYGDPINANFCKASFSGNANMSRYNLTALAPGNSVTVTIGDLLMDNGASASTGCNEDLVCNTAYVFRVFAHGDSKMNRSAFSTPVTFSTAPCASGPCVHGGRGYWKNLDIASWPQSVQDNGLLIGQNTYSASELQQILNTTSVGNGYLILAHQLIPALLNQASGADYSANAQGLTDAQTYLSLSGSNKLPPIGTAKSAASSQATLIAGINHGNHTCP